MVDSGDANEVVRYGIGMIISDQRIKAVVDAFSGITSADLARWQVNLSKLPRKVYVHTTAIDELKRAIIEIAGNHSESTKKSSSPRAPCRQRNNFD